MVGKVLTGNGITRCGRGSYALVGGEAVFAHRSRHRTPISGSIKVRVHRCARGRCECCGAHEHQRALARVSIIPKNHGGTDDLSNLQALCFRCNAGKRDAVCRRKRAPPTSAACRSATPGAWRAVCLRAGGQRPGAAGERAEVQSLTTNAFQLNSMRTWLSNRWISSGRARSSNAVRSGLPMLPVATTRSLAGVPRNR